MAVADKLTLLNEQLDELLMKQLQLLQDYISVTIECESHQKSGFLNLAKARYIQGFHSVSKNCLFSEYSEEERPAMLTVSLENSSLDLGGKELGGGHDVTYQEPILTVNSDANLENQLNKQFGILSSGTLKYAKTDFRKSVEKVIERAKIARQCVAIQEHYKALMKEKLEIENRIPAPAST